MPVTPLKRTDGEPAPAHFGAASISAAACLAMSLAFFLPGTVYLTNSIEFSNTLGDLIAAAAAVSIGIGLALTLLSWILHRLSPAIGLRVVAVVFALGVLVWFQGNFLLWPYGPLDGRDIPWASMRTYGLTDGLIWVTVILLALVLARRVALIAPRVGLVLIIVQLVYAAVLIVRQPGVPSFKRYLVDETDRFLFSSRNNVIVLVLDSFQTDIFAEIVRESPALADPFSGFTYFQNSLGSFPFTELSVASMLTGRYYDNSAPFEEWKERVYTQGSLPAALKRAGWQVHLFPKVSYCLYYSDAIASNFIPGLPWRERFRDIAHVYDISLFRAVPHFARRLVQNDHEWVFSNMTLLGGEATTVKPVKDATTRVTRRTENRGSTQTRMVFDRMALASHDVKFVDAALSESRVGTEAPVLKFFHWSVPHVPLILNENLQREQMDTNRANYKRYAAAGLKLVALFLEHLRELGIYDRSIIFVVGDHGAGIQKQKFVLQPGMPLSPGARVVDEGYRVAALPLILVKPLDASGPMRVSQAPVALSDIPATVFRSFGIPAEAPGTPMFELGEHQVRKRMFYRYSERDYYSYYGDMTEYVVNGYGWQDSAWRRSGRILTQHGVVSRRPLTEGIDLLFGDMAGYGANYDGFYHVETAGNTKFHWTDGAASIHVPIESGPTPTTLSVGVVFSSKPDLRLRILIDDCELASQDVPAGMWRKDIPLGACAPTGEWTTIRFLSDTARPGDGDRRRLGVALTQVVLH